MTKKARSDRPVAAMTTTFRARGGATGEVVVYDAKSGELLARHQVFAATEPVLAVALSPDGRTLACGAAGERALRVIDTMSGQPKWRRDHGTVYDAASSDPWGLPDEPRPASVRCLAYAADGDVLICGGEGESLTLWTSDGKLLRRVPTHGGTTVVAVAVSPAGSQFAAIDDRGEIRIARLDDPGPPDLYEVGGGDIEAIAFSPDGQAIAVTDRSGGCRVVTLLSGPPVLH